MKDIKHFVVGTLTGAIICALALLYSQHRHAQHLAALHAQHLTHSLAEVRVAFEAASTQYHETLEQQEAELSRLQQQMVESRKREQELVQLAETQAGAAQSIIEQFPEVQAYVSTLLNLVDEKDVRIDILERETAALRYELEASQVFIRELISQKVQLETSLESVQRDLHKIMRHNRTSQTLSTITTVAVAATALYSLSKGARK